MFLLALLLSTVSAFAWHLTLKRYWLACFGSSVTSVLAVWLVGSGHIGHFDRVFFENVSITAMIALIIALIVGLLVSRLNGRVKDPKKPGKVE